jgi:pSer/pThr/pTyr-binding forkhead associated (FHA) protein
MDPAGDWPVAAGQVAGPALGAGRARAGIARVRAALTGERAQLPATEAMTAGAMLTDAEPARPLLAPNPMLRLTTGDSVTQTRVSGARAGRGRGTELMLPDDPALSRVHARFTCAAGEWRITGLGRNGVLVNDTELTGDRVLRDGDVIQWGQRPESLRSWVEIVP